MAPSPEFRCTGRENDSRTYLLPLALPQLGAPMGRDQSRFCELIARCVAKSGRGIALSYHLSLPRWRVWRGQAEYAAHASTQSTQSGSPSCFRVASGRSATPPSGGVRLLLMLLRATVRKHRAQAYTGPQVRLSQKDASSFLPLTGCPLRGSRVAVCWASEMRECLPSVCVCVCMTDGPDASDGGARTDLSPRRHSHPRHLVVESCAWRVQAKDGSRTP